MPWRRHGRAKRRAALAVLLLTAVGALAPAARGQQAEQVRRIGFLASSNPEGTPQLAAFREGLRERGWVEGRNLHIEFRWAEGNFAQRPELAAELVRLKVDLIFAWASVAAAAAKRATKEIPIVFAAVGDPVGAGFVASLARPGGNVTGMSNLVRDVSGKQVEFLAQVAPGMRRLAIVRNPDNPITPLLLEEAQTAARTLGVEPRVFEARAPADFEGVFAAMAKERVAGVVLLGDPMILGRRQQLAQLAIRHRLPSIFIAAGYPEAGGLMSYGVDPQDVFRRAASYVDRILRGANPALLPVEQPTRLELVINLKTARALGVKIPQSLVGRADRVIE